MQGQELRILLGRPGAEAEAGPEPVRPLGAALLRAAARAAQPGNLLPLLRAQSVRLPLHACIL